jgi:hypothetical protein
MTSLEHFAIIYWIVAGLTSTEATRKEPLWLPIHLVSFMLCCWVFYTG